jgi:hypothetical protein
MRRVLVVGLLLVVGCSPSVPHVDAQPSVATSTPTPTATPTPTPVPTPTPTRAVPTVRPIPAKPRKTAPVLQSNRIYTAGRLGAVTCPLPKDRLSSRTAVSRYLRGVVACLDKAWAPVLKRAGFRFHSPVLHVFERKVASPCTGPSGDAFYCSEGDGIYVDWTSDRVPAKNQIDAEMDLIATAAHEYGHHVQELTGISDYYDDHFDTKKAAAQLEDSRRLELQAECFEGVFLAANKQTLDLTGTRYWSLNLGFHGDLPGQPRDHGSVLSDQRWAVGGFTSGTLASCRTWTAPPEEVS